MFHSRVLGLGACLGALVAIAPANAQQLYSQAVPTGLGRLVISLKLRNGPANATIAVTATPTAAANLIPLVSGPLATDRRGYGSAFVRLQRGAPTFGGEKLTVRLAHPSFPNGALVREYLFEAKNQELASAWPDFLQIQGVFCNPASSAATMLSIDRATDLDGNGVYGDRLVEAASAGRDPLDFPNEFVTDIRAASGCASGTGAGEFWPGDGGGAGSRTVAFFTDNRIVNGPCNFTSVLNFIRDMSFAPQLGSSAALLATGSGADTIIIGRDNDNDGNVSASEIKTFFDPRVAVNNENYSPDGVAHDPTATNRVYWISDKSGATGSPANQGLFRLTDANNDDSITSSEVTASWTGSSGAVTVDAVAVDASEFEALHVDSTGGVLVNSTADGTIFRWVDTNNNGVAQTGEVTNFFTYNAMASRTVNADIAASNPAFPALPGSYWAMNKIQSARAGSPAKEIYFMAWTNSSGIGSGYIFRGEDNNNDGDINDLGEVSVFVNPTQITGDPLMSPPSWTSGLGVIGIDENGNGTVAETELFVYIANPQGPKPNCGFTSFSDLQNWRFRDANGDGDATDPGENERIAIHPTGAFNRGLELMPNTLNGGFQQSFYSRSTLVVQHNSSCRTPAGDFVELDFVSQKLEEGTQGGPFGGNQRFEIVTRGNGGPTANAGLVLGGGLSASPIPVSGCNLWLSAPLLPGIIAPVVPDASGNAFFKLPIPKTVRGNLAIQPWNLQGGQLVLGEAAEMRVN